MRTTQAAYLAGLIDGEGTVTILRVPAKAKRGWGWRPLLSISNSSPEMLEFVQRVTGFRYFRIRYRYKGQQRPAYRWVIAGSKRILTVLDAVEPYLVNKRGEAQLLRESCELLQTLPGRSSRTNESRFKEISPRLREIELQFRRMHIKAPKSFRRPYA